jgi:outer membrane protein OmpA-like peptidoglycan-associated protein/tetratricopeptide (TPR) repeat protein
MTNCLRIAFILSIRLFAKCQLSHAQEDSVAQSQAYMEQADEIYKYQKEAIEIAKEMYVQAADLDPANVKANWMAGKLYIETINKDKALKYFQQVQAIDPNYRFDIDYQIGLAYHYGFDFDGAISHYEKYKKKYYAKAKYRGKDRTRLVTVDRKLFECKNAKAIISRPTQYSIESIGEEINSVWPDYAPVISEDESVMIFTSRRQEDNTSGDVDSDNFYFEEIYISRKQGDKWGPAENIGSPINTSYHDANIALSSDGSRLYLYKDTGRGDIYYSDYDGAKWSKPKFLSNRINSSTYAENSVSETSSPGVIIYSSDRPGGAGGIDLYYCVTDSKGNWYKSKSLGSAINTKYDEDSPFLDYDGKTLYFSSAGHKGYGGYDVFRTVYDSAIEQWSKPENLGYPVNTPDNELYFHPTKGGRTAYFASIREGGLGFEDIFMVRYHGDNSAVGETAMEVISRKAKFDVTSANSVENELIEGQVAPVFETYELNLIGGTHKVYFDASQSRIQEQHQVELDSIITLLMKYDQLKIDIAGFASSDGNPKYNLDLSHKRALIVFDFFVENGIPEDRIIAKGYGSLEHVEGVGEENRRAEVRIVGGG